MSEYSVKATADTPALIIYLVDSSGSMGDPFGNISRMTQVSKSLENVFGEMLKRSTRGMLIRPRYHVSVIAYADRAESVLPSGLMSIDKLAELGVPEFVADGLTNTADAFRSALDLLKRELPSRMNHPPPLICHLTDGEYSDEDPEPYARELMKLRTHDGAVLVENIFIGNGLTPPDATIENWEGLVSENEVKNNYARKLFNMSSVMPETIRMGLADELPHVLRPGSRMTFPASVPELVELAFAVSGASGVGKARR